MAKKVTIEKERRWLLKKSPEELWRSGPNKVDAINLNIYQFYKDGVRYRHTFNSDNYKQNWTKCEKTSIGVGVNQEANEARITEREFNKNDDESNKSIRKDRYAFNVNGYDCVIDDFDGLNICILEVEGVTMAESIHFPAWLEKYILIEVTGNSKFSNYELAEREDGEDEEGAPDFGDDDVMSKGKRDDYEDEDEDEYAYEDEDEDEND